VSLGAFVGPFVGVTLMMAAVQRISTGLAQTFLAVSPVMIIPFMRVLFHERVGWQAAAGAVLACVGILLLFVR
jgi:drug/metabolite transporter (DMT)-like permease